MATNGLDVKIVTVSLPGADWAGDDVTGHVLQAPTDAHGGGITLLDVSVVNAAATSAGTSFALQIENWGTAGNAIKTSGGTVVPAIGGTADPFAAGTPKAGSINSGAAFVDAGEWLVLRKSEDNSSDPTRGVVVIKYVMGA